MNDKFQILAWILLCCATIYPDTYNLIDTSSCKIWVNCVFTLSMLGLIYCVFSLFKTISLKFELFSRIFVFSVFALLIYSVVLYVGGITRHFTGGFDNSAGLALCLALAFSVIPDMKLDGKKWLVWALGIVFVLGLLFVKSRTGIVCVLFQLLMQKMGGLRRKWKWACLLLLMVVPILWYVKSASSLGRLFILLMSIQMISCHPFLGWGTGGFAAHYMDFQSLYLKNHPDSIFAILAGNTHHPLNEFVAIAVGYGVPALLLIVLLLLVIMKINFQRGNMNVVRMLSCIIIFSLFSYPLRYPITFLCLLIIVYESFRHDACTHRCAPYIIIGVASVFFMVKTHAKHKLYKQWSIVAIESCDVVRNSDLRKYQMLAKHEELADNPQFMYNYSLTLYDKGEYVLAQNEVERCLASYSDYDLELLAGDIYCALEKDAVALSHYKKAHDMCPAYIMPFYSMYKMYELRGKQQEMITLRRNMEIKRLKVKSEEVLRLLKDMKVNRKDV